MKRLFTYAPIMLLLSTLLGGCSKGSSGNVVPKQTNVYVFGNKGSLENEPGGYWKNNVFMPFAGTNGVSCGFVTGNDVYAAGAQVTGQLSENFGYWKNGVFTELDSARQSSAGLLGSAINSIYVSNNDVYVLANKQIDVSNTIAYVPVYWKNGKANDFTNGAQGVTANNIFVSGNDVYIAGNYYNYNQSIHLPKYWKNGVENILADENDQATAGQIFVSGNDVYVAGSKGNYGGYWKNGVFTSLTDGYQYGYAQLIFVSGKDVYVAGYETENSTHTTLYWKNGAVVSTLGNGIGLQSMYVSGSDVYVLGMIDEETVEYWKNGAPVYLTDGVTSAGYGGSIFVTTN